MSKIYTKRGDQGQSDLFYSRNINKFSPVFDALGNIDELNSFIGLLVSDYDSASPFVLELPHVLFDLGAMIAMEEVNEQDQQYINQLITRCEQSIDEMTNQLEPLKVFIVPGGSRLVSLAHVCRAITRRAERSLWELDEKYSLIGQFLNRLSDYFFTLSRYICHNEGKPEYRWLKREER
jgi:cob(I)alamin adenosyltransferase